MQKLCYGTLSRRDFCVVVTTLCLTCTKGMAIRRIRITKHVGLWMRSKTPILFLPHSLFMLLLFSSWIRAINYVSPFPFLIFFLSYPGFAVGGGGWGKEEEEWAQLAARRSWVKGKMEEGWMAMLLSAPPSPSFCQLLPCSLPASPITLSGRSAKGAATVEAFKKQTEYHVVKVNKQDTEKSYLVTCCFQGPTILARNTQTAS